MTIKPLKPFAKLVLRRQNKPRPLTTRSLLFRSPIPKKAKRRRQPLNSQQPNPAACSPTSCTWSISCSGPHAGRYRFNCSSVWSTFCCRASSVCISTPEHNRRRPRKSAPTVCSTRTARASMERWTPNNSIGKSDTDRQMCDKNDITYTYILVGFRERYTDKKRILQTYIFLRYTLY